ncbi:MAG: GGDEF domain-containing protein [Actinobacteria bacterium]|nr:GGDEF domain-containing protein [Actinomycetota bacterium]
MAGSRRLASVPREGGAPPRHPAGIWPVLLAGGAVAAGLHWTPGGSQLWTKLGALLLLGASVGGGLLALRAAVSASGPARRTWWAVGLGALCWAAGQAGWCWSRLAGSPTPVPSWCDLGFALFPLLTAIGLISVIDDPIGRLSRLRCGLEALMLTGSTLYIEWSLVPAEAVATVGGSTAQRLITFYYPSMDAWTLAMVLFASSRVGPEYRTIIAGIGAGLAAISMADGGFSHLINAAAGDGLSTTSAGWFLGFLLIARAALGPDRAGSPMSRLHRRIVTLVPYLLVAASVGVTVVRELDGQRLSGFLFWDAAWVLVLLVAHHISVLLENESLTAHLEHRIAERTASLEATERYYRALVQGSSDIVVVLDAELRARYVSDSVERVYALSPRRLLGRTVADLLPYDDGVAEQLALAASGTDPVLTEITLMDGRGDRRSAEVGITNRLDDPAVRGLVLNIRDVTERSRLERQLRHQAFHDGLTDLANRSLFFECAERAASQPAGPGQQSALLIIDLDGFKTINDNLGHHQGDELLRVMAARMSRLLREVDTLARLGGDEFAVLLVGIDTPATAMDRAEEFLSVIAAPTTILGTERVVTASIGVAMLNTGDSVSDVVRAADTAMYVAKFGGKSRAALFEPVMHEHSRRRFEMQGLLRNALTNKAVRLSYQPVYDLRTASLEGFEALLRWTDPSGRQVPPSEFIPMAEDGGLIVELGRWVLDEAISQLGAWTVALPAGPAGPNLTMAISLSAHQLHDPGLVTAVHDALLHARVAPAQLILEITESVFVADEGGVSDRLAALRSLGVRIAIDDFGTGYASLAYLQRLPVDILKIDRSFLTTGDGDHPAPELVRAIVKIADSLGLVTLAEGVESSAHVAILQRARCRLAQGFYYSPPLDAEAASALIAGSTESAQLGPVGGAAAS